MTTTPDISRRGALAAGLAGAGAVAGLTACGGGTGGAAGGAAASSPAGSSVAEVASVPVGKAIAAKADGQDVIVSRPTASTVACFSAICTHQGCTVQLDGDRAVCPCHGSVFNALTGKVIQTPAPTPLQRIPVQVMNGEIVTG
jgi:Rieske Fe-S protein